MSFSYDILLWLHFAAIALGGMSVFGVLMILRARGGAPEAAHPALGALQKRFVTGGRAALTVLLISGPLMLWLGYAGRGAALSGWFHAKLALVVIFTLLVVVSGFNAVRARGGDHAAQARVPQLARAGVILFTLILGTAVFAFH